MYLAHIRGDGKSQSLEAHLRGTAELCAKFAAAFGEEQRGNLIGYAHDIGKSSEAFQHRLSGGRKVDHATAGALECAKIKEILASCCVIGHHGGLPDFGNQRTDSAGIPTYWGRIRKGVNGGIPDYHWQERLPIPASKPEMNDPFPFLFGCVCSIRVWSMQIIWIRKNLWQKRLRIEKRTIHLRFCKTD